MEKTGIDTIFLGDISKRAPFDFGQHPKWKWSVRRQIKERKKNPDLDCLSGKKVYLSQFVDSQHSEVILIPRDRFIQVLDDIDDPDDPDLINPAMNFPFSSANFFVDLFNNTEGIFYQLASSGYFARLNSISQLGYLVPPRPDDWYKDQKISFVTPPFSHTRWIHSLIVAILTDLVLARNGFSKKERAPVVLAAGCHDIAMPCGGDSTKRIDPKGLDEEENFFRAMHCYNDSVKYWTKKFDFDLVLAWQWVRGETAFGRLLNMADKICYTALDCFQLGIERPGKVRSLCLERPLIMDIWQDIKFTPDKTDVGFTNAERLFDFLLLRAYEFEELLYNPYSRTLDLFLKNLLKPLYKKGIITKEQLLAKNDAWLETTLNKYYPDKVKAYIEPDNFAFEKFLTKKEAKNFAKGCSGFDHIDHVKKFSVGLDFPVLVKDKLVPIWRMITLDKKQLLEKISSTHEGYYVYYHRP